MANDRRLKLLVLVGRRSIDEDMLNILRSAFDLDLRGELNDALEALRDQSYDAVLAASADFLPLERGLAGQQASTVLNTIGEGVCVVSRDGRLLWANARMREFEPAVIDQVVQKCHLAMRHFDQPGGSARRSQQFGVSGQNASYDVVGSPVRNSEGAVTHVAAVVFNVTAARQARQKMDAIEEAGRELARLGGAGTAGMAVPQRLQFIEDRVVHFTRDLLHYDHFSLRIIDERTKRLGAGGLGGPATGGPPGGDPRQPRGPRHRRLRGRHGPAVRLRRTSTRTRATSRIGLTDARSCLSCPCGCRTRSSAC